MAGVGLPGAPKLRFNLLLVTSCFRRLVFLKKKEKLYLRECHFMNNTRRTRRAAESVEARAAIREIHEKLLQRGSRSFPVVRNSVNHVARPIAIQLSRMIFHVMTA